ncbi:acyltransferase [Pseudooceanicola sediminis]|uniref:Acyltransferase n=1 Tax=Pseudooceanicola sediminis TaxID=2211117 RepID=A0A399J429_9RHOB|nr:acyltransferase [Pseudooceanicola sediminis]KAA2315633.1 acyltransferase [Puniceibacterium sp. HSS470]RII40168.1 acyltransferase [Pseudooceanicola sediminis]|tara:strand:- start:102056 stop:103099 length:1044 start_codon:yes stop_codon:yes gene_type:complete
MKRHLAGLQVLRGLAATGVVVHHASSWLARQNPTLTRVEDLDLGTRGVELFFVLSGFIIYFIHAADEKGPVSLQNYALKRFVRIFPITFMVVSLWFAFLVVLNAVGVTNETHSVLTWLSSALIIPAVERPLPVVIWTLRHELFFYLVFACFFFSSRAFYVLLAIWALSCLAFTVRQSPDYSGVATLKYVLAGNLNLLFPMGVGVAALYLRAKGMRDTTGAFAVSVVALIVAPIVLFNLPGLSSAARTLIYGAVSACAIFAASGTPRRFPGLELIGDASFSIYLVHLLSFHFSVRLASPFVPNHPWIALLIMVTLGVAAGVGTYLCLEKPLLAAVTRWTRPFRAVRPA